MNSFVVQKPPGPKVLVPTLPVVQALRALKLSLDSRRRLSSPASSLCPRLRKHKRVTVPLASFPFNSYQGKALKKKLPWADFLAGSLMLRNRI